MSCISQAKDFVCHWRMTPFPINDLLKMKCYQNNQRFLWRAAYIYTVYTLYYTVCTLNFKLCESLTAPPTCVSLFLSHTQAYTGPISVSFTHSIAPYVQLSDKWGNYKQKKSAGRTQTCTHAPSHSLPPVPRHLCTADKHVVVIALRHACWAKFKLIRWQPKLSHPGISLQRSP